jgi:hypothetical protein
MFRSEQAYPNVHPRSLVMAPVARPLMIAAVVALVVAVPAQAQYLDPGAGSVIIQAIIAGVVGVATVVKLYWVRIRGLFRGRSGKSER